MPDYFKGMHRYSINIMIPVYGEYGLYMYAHIREIT